MGKRSEKDMPPGTQADPYTTEKRATLAKSRAFITKPHLYTRPEQNKSLANVCFPSDLPGSFEMSPATPETFLYSQVLDQSTASSRYQGSCQAQTARCDVSEAA